MRRYHTTKGIGIIEIIVGVSIITLSLLGIVAAFNLHFQAGLENTKRIQASYIAEEGMEAVRFLRDSGWTTNIEPLSVSETYYLHFDGLNWRTTTTPQYVDEIFERSFTLADVYRRDSDSDIVPATSTEPKTIDSEIRFVAVALAWPLGTASTTATTTYEIHSYLAKIF